MKKNKGIIYKSFGVLAFIFCLSLCIVFQSENTYSQDKINKESFEIPDIGIKTLKTPTEAYQRLFEALRNKEKPLIRAFMSKDSLELAKMQAGQSKKDVDEVLRYGFFTANMTDTLPAIRDERVKGIYGAIEVYSQTKDRWENMPFIIEDGGWKLAVGNMFGGTFISPEKPQSILEIEKNRSRGNGSGSGIGVGIGHGTGKGSESGKIKADKNNKDIQILSKPAAGYTKAARSNNVSGTVKLRVVFLANGRIGNVSVVQGLPHGLTERAIAAARQIRFSPQMSDGEVVSVTKTLVYRFEIY